MNKTTNTHKTANKEGQLDSAQSGVRAERPADAQDRGVPGRSPGYSDVASESERPGLASDSARKGRGRRSSQGSRNRSDASPGTPKLPRGNNLQNSTQNSVGVRCWTPSGTPPWYTLKAIFQLCRFASFFGFRTFRTQVKTPAPQRSGRRQNSIIEPEVEFRIVSSKNPLRPRLRRGKLATSHVCCVCDFGCMCCDDRRSSIFIFVAIPSSADLSGSVTRTVLMVRLLTRALLFVFPLLP